MRIAVVFSWWQMGGFGGGGSTPIKPERCQYSASFAMLKVCTGIL